MSGSLILIIIVLYFSLLLFISYVVGKQSSDNQAFFLGNRNTPWWVVAIGMVGSSISGVSFVSVPGMVRSIDFTYMQTVFGFFFGYLIIANVLLPLYYKLQLTSIYTYLDQRFGKNAYKTGASFFLVSKTIGAAARLYVVAIILQTVVFNQWNIPFEISVCLLVFLIWLYTFKSGIKTIVWTDTVQAIIMILALVLLVVQLSTRIQHPNIGLFTSILNHEHFRIFVFDDWHSKQNFLKQFFSGVFIAVVMTGLDQDMMQKNLSCRSLSDAQKNMYWYGMSFIPVNFMFLVLGLMLLMLSAQMGLALPAKADEILPLFATSYLGQSVFVLFVLGIISAAFSSADSALASLTTSFAVDIMNMKNDSDKNAIRNRRFIHVGISIFFAFIILIFQAINNRSVIDAIYVIASYTYGPLLGLFVFGLYTKRVANDKLIPFIAVSSPVFCYALNVLFDVYLSYKFGYELLMLNGFITFVALWFCSKPLHTKPE